MFQHSTKSPVLIRRKRKATFPSSVCHCSRFYHSFSLNLTLCFPFSLWKKATCVCKWRLPRFLLSEMLIGVKNVEWDEIIWVGAITQNYHPQLLGLFPLKNCYFYSPFTLFILWSDFNKNKTVKAPDPDGDIVGIFESDLIFQFSFPSIPLRRKRQHITFPLLLTEFSLHGNFCRKSHFT